MGISNDATRAGPTLGALLSVRKGQTYEAQLTGDEGPFLLGMGIFSPDGGFRPHKIRRYSGPVRPEGRAIPGTVVVATTDMGANIKILGRSARVPSWVGSHAVVSADMGIVVWRTEDLLARSYAYWVMRTKEFREFCLRYARGTAVRRMNGDDIGRFPIVDPRTKGLDRILILLDSLDEKIELNRRTNETLDSVARALHRSWFVDFDPVRAKAEGGKGVLPESVATLFPHRLVPSDAGEIPEGWRIGKLDDVAQLSPEVWSKETRPPTVKYLDLSNTKWGRIETVVEYRDGDAPSRAQRVLRPRDTIVGTVRPGNGAYAFITENGLTGSTAFAVLRPRQECYAEFIYLTATASENIEMLSRLADGGAYPAVRPEVVSATILVLPSDEVIESYSAMVGPLLTRMAANERECRTLANLRDTLLPRLTSGDLEVSAILEAAEGAT